MKNKRKTPIMGWASWNAFRTDINEELIREQAEQLVNTGLKDVGFEYVNIDDGYFGGRSAEGDLLFHPKRFPSGLSPLVTSIHDLGLKAGIYSDAGDNTCAHYYDNEGKFGKNVGLYGHEKEDLKLLFEENDFDFLKVDWCGGLRLGLDEQEQYTLISDILTEIAKRKKKDINFNICRWAFPGEWVTDVADSWRIGADIAPNFDSILYQLDTVKPLTDYNGPGNYNDLDMMQIGNGMTELEDRSHFAMWCMMSTPLLLGNDLRTIDEKTLEILKNKDLIELNQDPAGLSAYVIKEYKDEENLLGEIWLKDLGEKGSSSKALAFLNRSTEPITMELDLKEAGLLGEIKSLRDLTYNVEHIPTQNLKIDLAPHQTVVMKVEATEGTVVPNLNEQTDFKPSQIKMISKKDALERIKNGAILVDVRTPDEYMEGHLDGAVNIPYYAYQNVQYDFPENKDQEIILYCRTGKRAEQVAQILEYLNYPNVYSLGGLNN